MIIDTNSNCAQAVDFLVKRGVEFVGRYYTTRHPSYRLTAAEAVALSRAGIGIFTVFEDYGQAGQFTLTRDQGRHDATEALNQAIAVDQPEGSAIYFAVEGLPNGYRTADLPDVRLYFAGVQGVLQGRYDIGVYGDGVVCKTLQDEGICAYTWLAQASYSFEGSQAYYRSKRWNLAQILVDLPEANWRQLSVDIDEGIGAFGSFRVAA